MNSNIQNFIFLKNFMVKLYHRKGVGECRKIKAPSLEVDLRLGGKKIKVTVSESTHQSSGQSKVEVDEQNLEK